jgi:hypothetical protein
MLRAVKATPLRMAERSRKEMKSSRQTGVPSRALKRANRQIKLSVEAGSRVALFLNSDVHPDLRRCPVYAVAAENNDVWEDTPTQPGRWPLNRLLRCTADWRHLDADLAQVQGGGMHVTVNEPKIL